MDIKKEKTIFSELRILVTTVKSFEVRNFYTKLCSPPEDKHNHRKKTKLSIPIHHVSSHAYPTQSPAAPGKWTQVQVREFHM